LEVVKDIGVNIASAHAIDVDKNARFPREAVTALREAQLFSAFVPRSLGGFGCSFTDIARMCEILGQSCGSTAMVFAMHQIQVACVVRHGGPAFNGYLADIVAKQLVLGSVTSEVGVGGSTRTSVSCIERDGDRIKLDKDATTVSYGVEADDLLMTTRRAPESPPSDQVLMLTRRGQFTLEPKGAWDTMGMRGTCSPPFMVHATGEAWQILPVPYADISAQSMVPCSHVWWSSLWLGIATNAVARAAAFVRAEARKKPGTVPPQALRLAEVSATLQLMRASVHQITAETEEAMNSGDGGQALSTVGYAMKLNNLKLSTSALAPQICHQALLICGIFGYRNDSKFAIGRHLRDAHSAALMVGNDRIYATNSTLLLVHKDS
jgi:acyl-CoA dehydrogenase